MPELLVTRGGHHHTLTQPSPTVVSANTKGSWAEVEASLSHNIEYFTINPRLSTAGRTMAIDIGVGAAGSEKVLVADLFYTSGNAGPVSAGILPIRASKGQRLAVRFQSNNSASAPVFDIYAYARGPLGMMGYGRAWTLGVNLTDTTAVSVDADGGGSFGTWFQISSSTPAPFRAIQMFFGHHANAALSSIAWDFQIGVGAAAAEKIVLQFSANASVDSDAIAGSPTVPYPVDIPVGSRLSCRSICSSADVTDRVMDVSIVGYN